MSSVSSAVGLPSAPGRCGRWSSPIGSSWSSSSIHVGSAAPAGARTPSGLSNSLASSGSRRIASSSRSAAVSSGRNSRREAAFRRAVRERQERRSG